MNHLRPPARINKLAYIGWRGIVGCEVLELHPQFTGLVGPPGAGKSTLLMMLDYALIPDRDVLDIRPLSNLRDASVLGSDAVLGRIDPAYGYAYVVLDIMSAHGQRIVCGIQVHEKEGRAVFTGWHLRGSVPEVELDDLMAVDDAESIRYLALAPLKRHLATRGMDLHQCRSATEYGQILYDAGVTPSPFTNRSDRRLYASLLAATFKGGLSDEVVAKLKDYLLPPPSALKDLIGGLQEAADEVARTRSAIADAQRELLMLQSTYGIGKELVVSTVGALHTERDTTGRELHALVAALAEGHATLDDLDTKWRRLNDEIEAIERLRKDASKRLRNALNDITERKNGLIEQLKQAERDLAHQQGKCELFTVGQSAWLRLAKGWDPDFGTTLRAWLDQAHRDADLAAFQSAQALQQVVAELDRLRQLKPPMKATRLASALRGQALESMLADDNDEVALARILSLGNLREGVVGVTCDRLRRLKPADDFPDTFWIGAFPPERAQLTTVGQWIAAPLAGGHVVMSKHARSRYGRTGLASHIASLVSDHMRLAREARRYARRAAVRRGRRDTYLAKREQVDFYLTNRGQAQALRAALQTAVALQRGLSDELSECDRTVHELRNQLEDVEVPFEDQLRSLRRQTEDTHTRLSNCRATLEQQAQHHHTLTERQAMLEREVAEAQQILGPDWPKFSALATAHPAEAHHLVRQARRLATLNSALGGEVGNRTPALAAANLEDRVSVIRVWPELVAIVAEVIHSFTADTTHEDLIARAIERRTVLDEQLAQHENEMRVNARSLHLHITSSVRSERSKVERLSAFGRAIEFGNLMGVQVSLQPRTDMLEVLSGFAQTAPQLGHNRTVEDALVRHFELAEPRRGFTGQQLLDYRNYLELAIEVRRRDGVWTPADGLSGTEAIGGGLAVALMLTRAIAARNASEGQRAPRLEPLYCMDELGRIDQTAHASLMEFAERERFQLVVTAQSIESQQPCVQYALVRRFDPVERVIVRGLRVETAEKG